MLSIKGLLYFLVDVLFLLLLGKRLDVLSERELRECVPD
jgi:hypothetical protein